MRRVVFAATATLIVVALAAFALTRAAGAEDTVVVGPPGSVRAEWVDDRPVWVTVDDAGQVLVLDAVNPHPWNGMQELVGWCESSGWFQAWWDGSRFDGRGRYAFGPAPHDLPRYDVVETVGDGRARLGDKVVPPSRSHTDDEPDGPHCHGDGSGGLSTAEFHPIKGSGRQLFEGVVVADPDGQAVFCPEPTTEGQCPDDALSVPGVSSFPDIGLRGVFLARQEDGELRDVIYPPEGYDPGSG